VNVDRQFQLSQDFKNGGQFFLNINLKSSSTNNFDSKQSAKFPASNNNSTLLYGLGYRFNRLDDSFFPKRGLLFQVKIQTGNKEIIKSPNVLDSLYKAIQLNSLVSIISTELSFYQPLSRRGTLYLGFKGAWMDNVNMFYNEMFRFGGLQSLRGHNQNAFIASKWGLLSTEYRFLLEKESYLFLFYDQSILERNLFNEKMVNDTPWGVGVGLRLDMKAGIFTLIYAWGQSKEQNFSFDRSKIHFGFISRF